MVGRRPCGADGRVGSDASLLWTLCDSDEPSEGERGLKCPACGLLAYPRVAPAMITLVTRGPAGPDQEALLARGANFPMPMYSCLAGFVEPGEDLEGSVVREVKEEVGVDVDTCATSGANRGRFRTA